LNRERTSAIQFRQKKTKCAWVNQSQNFTRARRSLRVGSGDASLAWFFVVIDAPTVKLHDVIATAKLRCSDADFRRVFSIFLGCVRI